MSQKCIGIDIGGTTVKIGVFTTEGTLLEKWEVPTRKEEDGKYILGDIAASIKEKIAEWNMPQSDFVGAGMGLPGPVEPDGHIPFCVNLGWKAGNPQEELSALLGMPVKSGNDANVAALGEMWQGGGRGYKNLVMVTLGTCVGGGIILNEQIWPGVKGVAGEIGHMHVMDEEKEQCNCGGYGCLEQAASATGIARVATRMLAAEETPSTLREVETITAKDVLDAAKAGDELALAAINKAMRYLGWAMASITMVIDPQAYIIGGGVSKAGEMLFDYIRPNYEKYVFHGSKNTKFALATLGNDAGIVGAARLVLEQD